MPLTTDAEVCPPGMTPVTSEGLVRLVHLAIGNGTAAALPPIVEQWAEGAANEIVRLREANDELVAEAKKLLALIDAVGIDQNLGDETDRVFPRYEFDGLRAAVAKATSIPSEV